MTRGNRPWAGPGRWLALGVATLALAACGSEPPRAPDLILISVDTLRVDHLGAYGYPRDTSPNLDRLAAEGVRFDRAYAQAGWTLPSHASLFTSLYPEAHGVWHDGVGLPPSLATLPEQLAVAGYTTGAVVSWKYVGRRFGFDQGFGDFVELEAVHREGPPPRWSGADAVDVTDRALAWVRASDPEVPLFLFAHYFDPHADYEPPPPFDTWFAPGYAGSAEGSVPWLRPYVTRLKVNQDRSAEIDPADLSHVVALYDGEIRYTDREIGRLLSEAKSLRGREAVVVVLADHGEEFLDHGSMEGHGWTLYEEVVRVPLILRQPGAAAGVSVSRPVELIDVAPTLLELAGASVPADWQGRSLMPLARDPDTAWRGRAFSETRRFTAKLSVATDRLKLIYSAPQPANELFVPDPEGSELFDLETDPAERRNLLAGDGLDPNAVELQAALDAWRAANEARSRQAAPPPRIELTPEEQERLRSLGYL